MSTGYVIICGNDKGKKKRKHYIRSGCEYYLNADNSVTSPRTWRSPNDKLHRTRLVNNGTTIKKIKIPEDCKHLTIDCGFSRGQRGRVYNETCAPTMPLHLPKGLEILDIHTSAVIDNLEEAIGNENLTINFRTTT